jgi:cell division protein DivIC
MVLNPLLKGIPLHMISTQEQLHLNSKKGSHRRRRLLSVFVLCFVGWAGVTFWNQADLISEKVDRMLVMEKKLTETKQVNEQLKLEITRLNDDEYIEQKARKDFQMVGEGETLFISPESTVE